ncbi:MAG: hypothetical protein D6746_08580 [Bacteroidetes bacterium]|nr:MAG: hypothetical protein D6746_08580 [Bacteroidota bacterium]
MTYGIPLYEVDGDHDLIRVHDQVLKVPIAGGAPQQADDSETVVHYKDSPQGICLAYGDHYELYVLPSFVRDGKRYWFDNLNTTHRIIFTKEMEYEIIERTEEGDSIPAL